jgi:hypothetical protein
MRINRMDGVTEYALTYGELGLTERNLESGMGYRSTEAPAAIRKMMREVLVGAGEYCEIRGGFRLAGGLTKDKDKAGLVVGGRRLSTGPIIVSQIGSAQSAALFLCTAGPRLEAWSKRLIAEGEFAKGYMADAAASEAVEAAVDKIQNHLAESLLPSGNRITNRFSPGYCGWPVSDQHALFSLLPEGFCGVSLTPSSLMVPIKSVSGLIGIGTSVKFDPYPCRYCDMKDCFKRRVA